MQGAFLLLLKCICRYIYTCVGFAWRLRFQSCQVLCIWCSPSEWGAYAQAQQGIAKRDHRPGLWCVATLNSKTTNQSLQGMTETCTTVSLVPPEQKVGTTNSAGQLLPGVTARVVKPDGTLAKEGEQGELIVTGPSMALGYYKNPEA